MLLPDARVDVLRSNRHERLQAAISSLATLSRSDSGWFCARSDPLQWFELLRARYVRGPVRWCDRLGTQQVCRPRRFHRAAWDLRDSTCVCLR